MTLRPNDSSEPLARTKVPTTDSRHRLNIILGLFVVGVVFLILGLLLGRIGTVDKDDVTTPPSSPPLGETIQRPSPADALAGRPVVTRPRPARPGEGTQAYPRKTMLPTADSRTEPGTPFVIDKPLPEAPQDTDEEAPPDEAPGSGTVEEATDAPPETVAAPPVTTTDEDPLKALRDAPADAPAAPATPPVSPGAPATLPSGSSAVSGFGVQVRYLSGPNHQENAKKEQAAIESSTGLNVLLVASEDGKVVRVVVGSYPERETAEAVCKALRKRASFGDCFVKPLP